MVGVKIGVMLPDSSGGGEGSGILVDYELK